MTSTYIKINSSYKKSIRVLRCANYVYLDEINSFNFKKISKYNKSKNIYDKVDYDFKLVNKLINNKDLLNAAAILRTVYENIIYIIAKSYDKELKIKLDTDAKTLRNVLEKHHDEIFTDYFEKDDFNAIYKYLCKIVHPSSLKELFSNMIIKSKYQDYLLNNLRYIMIIIEYMYLNYLNKKAGNRESSFDLNFINICTYINLVNISYFIIETKDNKSFIKRYFYYDTNNKYITDNQEKLKDVYKMLNDKKELFDINLKELIEVLDTQIEKSKYQEGICKILSGKYIADLSL